MNIETIPIAELQPDPKNRRKHTARDLAATRESLEEFGQQTPIVVDDKGKVVKGNGTLQAAIDLGWETINVVRTKLKGKKQRRYAIADNRTGELAGYDEPNLVKDFRLPNFAVPGFSPGDVERMAKRAREAIESVAPPQKIRVTLTCPACSHEWEK